MKTRQEIKLQAKTNMSRQRATAILITLVAGVIGAVLGLFARIPWIGWIISFCSMFVTILLQVNTSGAFASIYRDEQTSVGAVISNCGVNPLRKIGGILWMALWIFLWYWPSIFTLGILMIVKALSYSMTPYILAECPDVTAKEALKLSIRMTNGHKGKLFVAQLSFIGWILLSMLTLFILMLFHVGPYMSTTMAGYYVELKKEALDKGVIRPEEFGGVKAVEDKLSGQEN